MPVPRPAPARRAPALPSATAAPRARSARTLLASAALAGALLAGPAAGSAAAANAATRCPTAGVTVARSTAPTVRVYRQAGRLRACVREPGERRRIRSLGRWRTGTTVAAGDGTVAWATPRAAGAGTVDAVTTIALRTGRRWLQTQHAVPATRTTRFADDRVLRLVVDDRVTAWVTAGGTVAAAVRRLDRDVDRDFDGVDLEPVGRRFVLLDVGPEAAPAMAASLALERYTEADDCGGGTDFYVAIDDPGAGPEGAEDDGLGFTYHREDVVPDPEICG